MGDKSKIEWCDATWNPVTGCTKVSQGCKNCYAERLFPRAYGHGAMIRPLDEDKPRWRKFADVQCHPQRLETPLRWKKPHKIFVNSMSDLFHERIPDEFIDQVLAVMLLAPRHVFQVLTKRAERMACYLNSNAVYDRVLGASGIFRQDRPALNRIGISNPKTFPVQWIHWGVSCEDQPNFDERVSYLAETPAGVRFVSLEPLLGAIDLSSRIRWLDWVIVGGESGPSARPMHPDWVRSIREQCRQAEVPFFFKQGSQSNWQDFKNFQSFPPDLQIREYPA